MLSSYLLLLLLTNQIREITSTTTIPACSWDFQWGETADLTLDLPNDDTACQLYFSDMLSLHNTDSSTHMLYRVTTANEFANCNSSSPIHDVSITGGSSFTVTINGGDFVLNAVQNVYMISEAFNGGCLQLAFYINFDSNRNCDITEGDVCSRSRATNPPMPPAPGNATNATNPGNATIATIAPITPKTATQSMDQGLTGFEIFLIIACCLLGIADLSAIGVLVFLCVYLPSDHTLSCEITRGHKGAGPSDRGTEMKAGNVASWRQRVAH